MHGTTTCVEKNKKTPTRVRQGGGTEGSRRLGLDERPARAVEAAARDECCAGFSNCDEVRVDSADEDIPRTIPVELRFSRDLISDMEFRQRHWMFLLRFHDRKATGEICWSQHLGALKEECRPHLCNDTVELALR